MTKGKTELASFENSSYNPGSFLRRSLWYIINVFFCKSSQPSSKIRILLLRLFGAKIGKGVIIKPSVNIKYPWKLDVGDFVWIGEGVWIDNLDAVTIDKNVCISQGAMLFCGNHNYKKSTFDLQTAPIRINEGVWVGAKSVICPGVICESHSLLTVGSVATKSLDAYSIYKGNPAVKTRDRIIQ